MRLRLQNCACTVSPHRRGDEQKLVSDNRMLFTANTIHRRRAIEQGSAPEDPMRGPTNQECAVKSTTKSHGQTELVQKCHQFSRPG